MRRFVFDLFHVKIKEWGLFEFIKLDKFFADGINDSEISLKVIDFILDICRLSDKSIVIEGIEEKEQVNIIKTFLYEKIYIQGYYFSKPLDIKSLKAYTF